MSRPYPVMPGLPAAGHVAGGFWHPGPIDACTRCTPPYSPMHVYDVCLPLGLWDGDDVLHCFCGRSWSIYYTREADAIVIQQVQAHARNCRDAAIARRRRAGKPPDQETP
jgi:hypothetical protein